MFALEFLNFAYNVEEFSSRSEVFYSSPFNVMEPLRGIGFGVATGTVPGDLYGGLSLSSPPFTLSLKAYRSGEVLITTLPDTTSPPSEDNPPQVVDRVRFSAYEGKVGTSRRFSDRLIGALALKFIYAGAGRYGWGAGGGVDASLLYSPANFLQVYLGLKNLLSSPVVWSTGKREFALPVADLRFKLRLYGPLNLLLGGAYSPDGRGFSPIRDGFVALRTSLWRMDIYGGLVEGKGRMGLSYRHGRATFSLGASYHLDFGYSFLGGVSLSL